MTTMKRKIVHIDEDKCDGCGLCVPSCAEGAIQIIDGKAKLLADNLCDGIGNCLGTCPKDAIRIEEREADAFDEEAVEEHLAGQSGESEAPAAEAAERPQAAGQARPSPVEKPSFGGCPGMKLRTMSPRKKADGPKAPVGGGSQLQQWPVQLGLLPAGGDLWKDADVLLAADCVSYAMGDFHDRLLKGKTLAIACPKLDDPQGYVDKLAGIFAEGGVKSLTIARMEVPCCGGLERIVQAAMDQAGVSIPLTVVVVAVDGAIQEINGCRVA
jgi:NAD-dependent dihydropyrimidine dehydrogenase PreA subunit